MRNVAAFLVHEPEGIDDGSLSRVDRDSGPSSRVGMFTPKKVALEALGPAGPPERLNELTRSRFRLLRAFSGLWLLHNARVAGGA